MKKKTRSILIRVELTLLMFVAVAVGMGIWQSSRSRAAKGWPTAEGVMTKAGVRWTSSSRSRHVGEKHKDWYADLRYEYTVRGVKHSSRKLGPAFITQFASEAAARGHLKKHGYRAGAGVKVYYNPKDPSDAVLQPGEISAVLICFAALLFAVPAAIIGLILLGPPLLALAFAAGEKRGRGRTARRPRRPERKFPITYTCPGCGKTHTIRKPGRYKCGCGAAFSL